MHMSIHFNPICPVPSNGGNVSYSCRVGCSGKLNPNLFLPYLFVSHSRHQLCSISDGPIWDCSKLFGQTCSHTPRSGTPWLKSFQRFWRPEKHCAIFDHPTCTVTLRSGACACCCCLIPFWERPIRGAFSCHFLLIGLRLNDLVDLILGYLSNHIFPWFQIVCWIDASFWIHSITRRKFRDLRELNFRISSLFCFIFCFRPKRGAQESPLSISTNHSTLEDTWFQRIFGTDTIPSSSPVIISPTVQYCSLLILHYNRLTSCHRIDNPPMLKLPWMKYKILKTSHPCYSIHPTAGLQQQLGASFQTLFWSKTIHKRCTTPILLSLLLRWWEKNVFLIFRKQPRQWLC